ncbi:hypothetical protein LN426_14570 [Pseudomonas syringae]|uniref:hypothetical protein n=1 Tax=Pseudomonas syringae TaxID=317 RepID=UPI0018E615B6|nr:hypothetical protein [Pseudomonas syringae]MBI6557974.1 hypothetical protein [Pseudomonas syringae]MBI6571899.1 hypothetical protein [Pseudomonas syringae]MBI6586219.1 hypothetical protein [Pseudomonas syringae]MBI6591894.1 hypothetical protein [Pseudomonas syringae]MDC6494944.1 hypothetical protein [Pseudomonas syringae]
MTAKTAAQRVKQQRQARLDEGWVEVRVWAPTADAAADIRQYAEKLRRDVEQIHGLDEVCNLMNQENYKRIKEAILKQGSPAYITESGPVLELLTELALEGHLRAISSAFNEFSKAKPGNMLFVKESIPAKILNHYWLNFLKLNSESLALWVDKNPEWASTMKSKVRDPAQFENFVNFAADKIRRVRKQHE